MKIEATFSHEQRDEHALKIAEAIYTALFGTPALTSATTSFDAEAQAWTLTLEFDESYLGEYATQRIAAPLGVSSTTLRIT